MCSYRVRSAPQPAGVAGRAERCGAVTGVSSDFAPRAPKANVCGVASASAPERAVKAPQGARGNRRTRDLKYISALCTPGFFPPLSFNPMQPIL